MKPTEFDPLQTRHLSTFMARLSEQGAYLIRIHPVLLGEGVITLSTKVTFGRDSDCELTLEDYDVSRRHATIEFAAGEYVISDLGSTNGTLVNDKKVQRAILASGDMINMGKTLFKFLRGNNAERQYHETVYSMMINDGLTGIPNKRFFQDALQRELTRSQRHKRPLAIAVLDIDHFKAINDTHGHLAGDVVLRELCTRVRHAIRSDEVFARYGGEEFVVLMPEASLHDASLFAERIRELVAKDSVVVGSASIKVTISIGIAHTSGEVAISAEELFKSADQKLYEAKKSGRNCVKW